MEGAEKKINKWKVSLHSRSHSPIPPDSDLNALECGLGIESLKSPLVTLITIQGQEQLFWDKEYSLIGIYKIEPEGRCEKRLTLGFLIEGYSHTLSTNKRIQLVLRMFYVPA